MIEKHLKKRKGFTLAEVLIAATIFTIVSLIGVNVFVNVIRIQRRVALENAIYEDARVMMERISREIRENTVDYEEYYNKASDQELSFATLTGLGGRNPFGNRYGCYAKRFYNPGVPGPTYTAGPENGFFGAFCNDGSTPESNPGCIIDKNTLDINTGMNPYSGFSTIPANGDPDVANAFCDQNQAPITDVNCKDANPNHNAQNSLYLIDSKGAEKTFLALKEISTTPPPGTSPGTPPEHALALLRLTGQDADKDGVNEVWRDTSSTTACMTNTGNKFCCSAGFDCTDASVPFATSSLENTLTYNADLYRGFVPISPTRTDVVSLKFFVSPLEDPRKAFAETDLALGIQQQPHVTVVLTVQPSLSSLSGYNGDVPQITIQTTVTSRVYNEIKSYYTLPSGIGSVCAAY